jgi:hypothetical protein
MKNHSLRRRFSFALPACVFLFFTVAETVEVRALSDTLLSVSEADETPPRRTCESLGKPA